jgi:hypothetical protein
MVHADYHVVRPDLRVIQRFAHAIDSTRRDVRGSKDLDPFRTSPLRKLGIQQGIHCPSIGHPVIVGGEPGVICELREADRTAQTLPSVFIRHLDDDMSVADSIQAGGSHDRMVIAREARHLAGQQVRQPMETQQADKTLQ